MPSEPLPTLDSGTPGSVTRAPGASGAAANHEPAATPPLLRGQGGTLVGAESLPSSRSIGVAETDHDVDEVVAQLAPIRSHELLASSFSREANPDDAVVRAAYRRVWASLSLVIARRTTRRARIRAMTARGRRGRIRGPG